MVARVARSMMSAEVGPPSSIVAAWITQRAGMSPALVSTASPEADRALLVGLALHHRPARPRDRRGHAASVGQVGVGGVGDRVHLELRHVGRDHLELRHGPHPDECRSRLPPFVVRVNAANRAARPRGARMRYLLNIYADERVWTDATPEQQIATMEA